MPISDMHHRNRDLCKEWRQSLDADLVYSWGFTLALGLTKLAKDIRNLFLTKQYKQECDFHRLPEYSDSLGIEKGQNFKSVTPSLSFTTWQWSKTSYKIHQ